VLTISLVTPSRNQSRFLEEAIASVLDQEDPALEYVIADGASTDESPEIIERHAARLTAWWSRVDEGPADAVNRAFAQTTGEIMGWLNADDRLMPGSLEIVRDIFTRFPEVEWLTSGFPVMLDEAGRVVRVGRTLGFARQPFLLGLYGLRTWSPLYFVQQESTFWRRKLWEVAGGALDASFEPAADFELWRRFFDHSELWTVDTIIAGFRIHGAQRTATQLDEYRRQAIRALPAEGETRLLAARAAARLPAGLRRRVEPGWRAPAITWSRTAAKWHPTTRLAA
jgi:glycosyltransferase involved in cell wall biosynthesis